MTDEWCSVTCATSLEGRPSSGRLSEGRSGVLSVGAAGSLARHSQLENGELPARPVGVSEASVVSATTGDAVFVSPQQPHRPAGLATQQDLAAFGAAFTSHAGAPPPTNTVPAIAMRAITSDRSWGLRAFMRAPRTLPRLTHHN